ncbi:hypothetical protein RKLH11_2695 [Rhodobacteraceae bacterium KLH11]|nr:hypothetical protein RKLH11_2695 [Rhodobacteraceae bacterium KLH11]
MTQDGPTWGIVCTTRAPLDDILRFAAHHIDLGVDRLHVFLDEPNRRAVRVLRRHPKIEIRVCNGEFWQRRGIERPEKHQVRQSHNATFIYRQTDLDWLAHIDIDEFLWPHAPVKNVLADIPSDTLAARIRPMEALCGGEDMYKAYIPSGPERAALVETLYPNFGGFVLGGFLSHVQGKIFVRSGLKYLKDRIHNVYQSNVIVPARLEIPQIELCHRHAPDWEHWLAHYRFRLERGSYQPGMSPNAPRHMGGLNMHELLSWIEAEQGEVGLRAFYDELSGADPNVQARLKDQGLLRHRPLNLGEKVTKHFPGTT